MGVFPDFDGLGGIGDLRAVVGALLTFVLIVAVLMLIVSAIVWAIATAHGNYATASKGRIGVLVAVGAVLFICVAGALILATVMAVIAIYEAAHVPTIRLVQTGQKPPLPMELEHQYHMFCLTTSLGRTPSFSLLF